MTFVSAIAYRPISLPFRDDNTQMRMWRDGRDLRERLVVVVLQGATRIRTGEVHVF
jgi:hypothetical protein